MEQCETFLYPIPTLKFSKVKYIKIFLKQHFPAPMQHAKMLNMSSINQQRKIQASNIL